MHPMLEVGLHPTWSGIRILYYVFRDELYNFMGKGVFFLNKSKRFNGDCIYCTILYLWGGWKFQRKLAVSGAKWDNVLRVFCQGFFSVKMAN